MLVPSSASYCCYDYISTQLSGRVGSSINTIFQTKSLFFMKALQQVAHGDPAEVVILIDMPDPQPGPDEIVVEIEAAGLHLAEIKRFRGDRGFHCTDLPRIPGYEGVGIVVKKGTAVTRFDIGDRVFPGLGKGTFCQQVCLSAAEAIPAPQGNAQQLALMTVNGTTALILLEDFVDLKSGDWLVQNGANSNCGRNVIVLAKERGIKTCNVVRRAALFDELYELGADICIKDCDDPDEFAANVKAGTEGANIYLGIDLVADKGTMRIARSLARGGTVVNYGFITGMPCQIEFYDLFFNDISLVGMSMGKGLARRNSDEIRKVYEKLAADIAEGKLKAAIAGTYSLKRAREAFAHAVRTGEDRKGKIVILPNS